MSLNPGQLTPALDLLTEPAELSPSTDGTGPTAARDARDLSDMDLDQHDRVLEAELADAITSGCRGPRRCECENPFGDVDPDGDVYCCKCGRLPDRNGGPP